MKTVKTKTIIVRGCKVKVLEKYADKIEREERELIRKDWNTNNLMD